MILKYNIFPNANLLDSFPKGIYSPVISVHEVIRARLITYCAVEKPATNIPVLPESITSRVLVWIVFAAKVVSEHGDPNSMNC